MISKIDLERAFSSRSREVLCTPLKKSNFLSEKWQAEVYLKHEQTQSIGAFKIRGASHFIHKLTKEQRNRGVVTHSSGNHAQALAYVAYKHGVNAVIVMPENSNALKISNARKWGAEIVLCEPTFKARIDTAKAIEEKEGMVIVPPFDHQWIIEGQSTAAMEMIAEKEFDYLVTPLGGGGLLSGTALAAKHFCKSTKVVGAEPENAKDGFIGFSKGKRVEEFTPNTVADGLRTLVGKIPFEIIKKEVAAIWLAKEDTIIPWMYKLFQEEKIVVEPSSVVPIAAIDDNMKQIKGKRVGIILTGGNVDFQNLPPYSDLGL